MVPVASIKQIGSLSEFNIDSLMPGSIDKKVLICAFNTIIIFL
ncbi:hypothetical protein B481_2811 [Planococcus halocryophilus Or1]|nr:hypothetical protein B481_2811 [Planococcus halocryophilus Or1]